MKKLKKLSDKEYKFIYTRTPRLCVDVLVFNGGGFLLSKREIPPFIGFWHFPGGRVFYKESIQDAAKRIAREEIGVGIRRLEMLGYYEMLEGVPDSHDIVLVFAATIISGIIRGSGQARDIRAFRESPPKIIPAQRIFLKNNLNKIKQLLRGG